MGEVPVTAGGAPAVTAGPFPCSAIGRLFTLTHDGPHGETLLTRVHDLSTVRPRGFTGVAGVVGSAGEEGVLVVSLHDEMNLGDGVYVVRPRGAPACELYGRGRTSIPAHRVDLRA